MSGRAFQTFVENLLYLTIPLRCEIVTLPAEPVSITWPLEPSKTDASRSARAQCSPGVAARGRRRTSDRVRAGRGNCSGA